MAKQEDDERPVTGYPESLGPDIHSGGDQEPAGVVPPYEGREGSADATKDDAMAKAFSGEGGPPGPGREVSDAEEAGVPATDTTGATPLGVGESKTAGGEEAALGDSEEKRREDREETSLSPVTPVDPESPNLQPGDQGG